LCRTVIDHRDSRPPSDRIGLDGSAPGVDHRPMDLIVGAGRLERRISDAEELLVAYQEDTGTR